LAFVNIIYMYSVIAKRGDPGHSMRCCEGKSGRHREAILPVLQFPLSGSFHQRSTHSFIVLLHLSEGQAGETQGLSSRDSF